MLRTDLFITYTIRGKQQKKVKLSPLKYPFVVGNSKKANMILNGAEVSPFHSALEYRNGCWFLMDLSSETGTWIDNEVVAETKIDKPLTFRVGSYLIKVEPKDAGHPLYDVLTDGTGKDHHEVVVKNKKGIVETVLLEKTQSFVFKSLKGDKTLKAPKSGEWITSNFDKTTVMQRLVKAPQVIEKSTQVNPLQTKKLTLSVISGLALLFAIIFFFPKAPNDESEIKKLETNRYTKLVYDSKLVRQKREEAMKIAQEKFKAPEPQKVESSGVTENRKQAQAAPKVITNIKASGLQQLLGKIAQRQTVTNKNVIISNGTTDYEKGRGPASVGGSKMPTVSGVSGGVEGTGKGFELSAIGTKGVGGGGNTKGYGSLKGGGIGTADVGAVEDEADIGAGLDKDAVAAVIRANIGQIRYCYERKLVANPNLYGKILVQFSIEGQGSVLRPKVSRTSMQDTDVEGCILRRLAQWKFPTPPVGTSVLVTYPFLFKSTQ